MDTLLNILHWIRTALHAADLMPDLISARGVFCLIAWIATVIAVLQTAVSLVMDMGDGDVDMDVDHGGEVGVFSVRALIGFLLGFGWGGYMAVQNGLSTWASVGVGVLLGVVMFFVIAGVIRFIYSLKSDGSQDFSQKTMVGMTGTVYVTLAPHGETGGQVQVSREGSQLITMPAIQQGDDSLPAGTPVEVIAATAYQLTVKRID